MEAGEQVDPGVLAVRATWSRTLLVASIWLAIWWLPIGLVALIFGGESVFAVQGVFFSKAALVTFGGAYSVLTYIAQEAVHRYGWLKPAEMLDGLGLAETTPGPLIMVVQFVAFLGAYNNPGEHLSPLAAGVLGSVVTVWATFAPCFLYIMTGAPWIESMRRSEMLSAGLATVTAAVVGVVLNLAIWLAVNTLFRTVHEVQAKIVGVKIHWLVPEWQSLSFGTLLCMSVALVLIFVIKRSVLVSLAITVAVGLVWYAVFGTR